MSRALRIAVVAACPYPWPRGTPIRIHRMALALAERGHEVHVVTYHLGAELSTSLPLRVHRIRNVPGYRRTSPGPTLSKLFLLDPLLTARLRGLHRDIAFDVVHAHHYEGLMVAAAARSHVPIVYDAHTTLGGELPTYRLGMPRAVLHRAGLVLDRRAPALAHSTIAVSDSIRDSLITLGAVSGEDVAVIPNGVEWQLFARGHEEVRDPNTVLFAGNLAPYQRIDLLLEAFAQLLVRRPLVRLLIVTESDFTPYQQLALDLGVRESIDVRSAPFSEQPALLARAVVAVNPRTDCDGMPQKVLNYMAAGLPIVSFMGSGAHIRHEENGLLVADGDTRAMAREIERVIDGPQLAGRLGSTARELVRRDFTWDAVARRVEAVYESVLSAART